MIFSLAGVFNLKLDIHTSLTVLTCYFNMYVSADQVFNDQLLALALLLIFISIHDSCAHYIHTIRRSYWMNWNPHLSCWILENSQIVWILEVAMVPLFFMLSILHLTMCHQSLLVCLSLTRKFTLEFQTSTLMFIWNLWNMFVKLPTLLIS